MQAEIKKLRDMMMKDLKEMGDGHNTTIKQLKDMFDKDRSDRDSVVQDLNNKLGEIDRELMPHARQVPGLHNKLRELSDTLHPQVKDAKDSLDRHRDDTMEGQRKVESMVNDLQRKLDNETAARNAMMDELEQMNSGFRSKMRGLLNDEAEKNKKVQDQLQKDLTDLVAQLRKVDDTLNGTVDQVVTNKQNLDEVTEGQAAALGELSKKMKMMDELDGKVRDLRIALEAGLNEDKAQVKMIIDFLEQHCNGLESLFNDLGHRLLDHGLKKGRGPRIVTTSSTSWKAEVKDQKTEQGE